MIVEKFHTFVRASGLLVLAFFTIVLLLSISFKSVSAGDEACTVPGFGVCWATRTLNQWECEPCAEWDMRCASNPHGGDQDGDFWNCDDYSPDPCGAAGYGGPCVNLCVALRPPEDQCTNTPMNVPCNITPGNCNWIGDITNCEWSGGLCDETTYQSNQFFPCCGPGGATPPPTNT